jgi:hypothetical protein
MPLAFENLDGETRGVMCAEIESDIANGSLYIAENRLSPVGQQRYPGLLLEAAKQHDDAWLTERLSEAGVLNTHQDRHLQDGRVIRVKVPVNAAETLAEGEYNKFYIRAVCMRAIADPTIQLVAYRAKAVQNPRPESEAKIGAAIDPRAALEALRTNVPWETTIGLALPNSGLSVRIARAIPAAAPRG